MFVVLPVVAYALYLMPFEIGHAITVPLTYDIPVHTGLFGLILKRHREHHT